MELEKGLIFMGEISQKHPRKKLVIVRGGGDLATGVIQKLWHVGFKNTSIRNRMSFWPFGGLFQFVMLFFQKEQRVEDLVAVRITSLKDCRRNVGEQK